MKTYTPDIQVFEDKTAVNKAAFDYLLNAFQNGVNNWVHPVGTTNTLLDQAIANDTGAMRDAIRQKRYIMLDELLFSEANPLTPSQTKNLFYSQLAKRMLDPIGHPEDLRLLYNINAHDYAQEALTFDKRIADIGGIDLAIVGLGSNGHIGLIEPGTNFTAKAHIAEIDHLSQEQLLPTWKTLEATPKQAFTLGPATLAQAKQTLLMVCGAHKKEIFNRAMFGPVTPDVPASILQTLPNVSVFVDNAAYSCK